VPFLPTVFDGNTADVSTHLENLRRLRDCLQHSDFLYIADSKFAAEDNIRDVLRHNGRFLSTAPFYKEHQARFVTELMPAHQFQPVEYQVASQKKTPSDDQEHYEGFEVTETIRDEAKTYPIRWIFMKSSQLAKQQQATRERKLEKLESELKRLKQNINKYQYTTRQAIESRFGGMNACALSTLSQHSM
jgi:transposase